jgi:Glutathione S-transferase, N-terminal domain
MALVLHGFRYSVYVRVARIALAEKALAYEHVEIDPFAPDMPTKYLDLHPFGRVPTLVDGDFVLYAPEPLHDISMKLSPARCCSQRNHVTAPEWCSHLNHRLLWIRVDGAASRRRARVCTPQKATTG